MVRSLHWTGPPRNRRTQHRHHLPRKHRALASARTKRRGFGWHRRGQRRVRSINGDHTRIWGAAVRSLHIDFCLDLGVLAMRLLQHPPRKAASV